MSDNSIPRGDEPQESSGSAEANQSQDKVAYETYQKLLGEKKSRDAQLAEYQKRFDEIEAKRKADAEAKLKEKEDFASLLKLREEELNELKDRLNAKDSELGETKRTIENGIKLQTFLGALEGNVDRKFWNMIDLDSIVIDPTSGTPDPTSIKRTADLFAKTYPELIRKNQTARTPDSAASGAQGLSYEQWLKLPVEEMKRRQKDII